MKKFISLKIYEFPFFVAQCNTYTVDKLNHATWIPSVVHNVKYYLSLIIALKTITAIIKDTLQFSYVQLYLYSTE